VEPIIQRPLDGTLDTEMVVAAMLRPLLNAAESARQLAEHYNHFKVGASVLALKESAEVGSIGIFAGWNRKLKSGPCKDRRCAEMHAMWDAFESGYKRILAVAVHAPHQADDATGLDLGVLICCGYCRNSFRALMQMQMLVDPDVLFHFRNAQTGFALSLTLGELLARCGGDRDPAIYTLGTPVTGLLQQAGRSP